MVISLCVECSVTDTCLFYVLLSCIPIYHAFKDRGGFICVHLLATSSARIYNRSVSSTVLSCTLNPRLPFPAHSTLVYHVCLWEIFCPSTESDVRLCPWEKQCEESLPLRFRVCEFILWLILCWPLSMRDSSVHLILVLNVIVLVTDDKNLKYFR